MGLGRITSSAKRTLSTYLLAAHADQRASCSTVDIMIPGAGIGRKSWVASQPLRCAVDNAAGLPVACKRERTSAMNMRRTGEQARRFRGQQRHAYPP